LRARCVVASLTLAPVQELHRWRRAVATAGDRDRLAGTAWILPWSLRPRRPCRGRPRKPIPIPSCDDCSPAVVTALRAALAVRWRVRAPAHASAGHA